MGKYIRKSKTRWEVTVTQSSSLSLGVRTRAQKTLAAQQQQQPTNSSGGGGSYLQLRSRRLEKPPTHNSKRSPKSISKIRASLISPEEKRVDEKQVENSNNNNNNDVDEGIEASFGENCLELDGRERSTRESTPCSLNRDPDAIRTPGSTTRSPELNRTIQTSARRSIPTAQEMDAFFAAAEEKEQREFIEKYNFDPVNEEPLPGQYKWVKVDP